ncbi:MAG TPA: TIGR03435 family protein [Vicinamibacterales bacterium]|jgi:uncharacterized protein (TIGR03435 family)
MPPPRLHEIRYVIGVLLWVGCGVAAPSSASDTFDVASVKPNTSDHPATARFPLGPGDAFVAGGLFSATNQPLIAYLRFAFKLGQGDLPGLPRWIYDERFDIEARAPGNPTKDQMRLMMQSLLAERFNLKMHRETQTKPILVLNVVKEGKTGPHLRRHEPPESCNEPPAWLPPIRCGSIGPNAANAPGLARLVGRQVTMARVAEFLMNPVTGIDRPVVDRTGLAGNFDFSVEWSPAPESATPRDTQIEDTSSTFLQAVREQLGLKLDRATGPVSVTVVDHIERPTAD